MPSLVAPDLARPRGRGLRPTPERATAAGMLQRFSERVGVTLRPGSVVLDSGARILVDGATADESLYVEAHGPQSPVPDIDLALIVQDVFKLALLRSVRPDARAVVLVADAGVRETVAACIARTPAADLVELVVCS